MNTSFEMLKLCLSSIFHLVRWTKFVVVLGLVTPGFAADQLFEKFQKPPAQFKTMPFWHLNGKLTKGEVYSQLEASRDRSGFSGVAVLPVSSTEPTFLSEDYFACYREILDQARSLVMEVIFYDDINFPSGSAGGQLAEKFPNDTLKRLDKVEVEIQGPLAYSKPVPAGTLMGVVAMNTSTLVRCDLTSGVKAGNLVWNAPSGHWKIMFFVCVNAGSPLVDYLCPESVDKFISLTYEEYFKRFKEHFGTTIRRNFYDDVGFYAQTRPWTPAFNEKFRQKRGFDPVPYYPALWYDIGPETQAARVALLDFRAELLAEGYPSRVSAWCRAHGILSSGHPPGNYDPCPVDMHCDTFKFYRHTDIPLMDAIFFHGHGRPGFKLISSAADVYDRPIVAAEEYGAYNEGSFDSAMLHRTGMELFARGVNFVVPHGMWYDPNHVGIPPLISHFSDKLVADLPAYNQWAARNCLMLQGGRRVADVAVLYPIASLEGFYQFNLPDNRRWGQFVPPDSDYQVISDLLTCEVRRDFTFIHPETLQTQCELRGSTIRLNNTDNWQSYQTIIIPSGDVIHWSSLCKIKEFYDHGGKVIATTRLPSKSAEFGHDKDVQKAIRDMFGVKVARIVTSSGAQYSQWTNPFGGKAYAAEKLTAATLEAILNDAIPEPDVFFEANPKVDSGNGHLSYIHKVKEGRDIYLFANSSSQPLDTWVRLRGRFTPQLWDPSSGQITKCEWSRGTEGKQKFTRVHLILPPVESVFVVSE